MIDLEEVKPSKTAIPVPTADSSPLELEEVPGPAPNASALSVGQNLARAAGKGAVHAVRRGATDLAFSIPQLVAGMADLGAMALPEDKRKIGDKSATEWVNTARDTVGGKSFGLGSELLSAAGAGAALGKVSGAPPVRSAIAGALGEAGGRAGGVMAEAAGVNSLWGSIPGSMFAGSPALLNRGPKTTTQLLQEVLKGRDPQAMQDAIALQRLGRQHGVQLQPSQLFDEPGAELRLLQDVLDSRAGAGQLERQVFSQFGQSRRLAEQTRDALGTADTSVPGATVAVRAVEDAMKRPREVAWKLAQPFYNVLEQTRPQLPPAERFAIANDLVDLNQRVGLLEKSAGGSAVNKVARTATEKTLTLSQQGTPFQWAQGDIYALDNYLKELSKRINKLSSPTATSDEAAMLVGVRSSYDAIRSRLMQASPVLKDAKDTYANARTALDTPIRNSQLPKAAPKFANPMDHRGDWKQLHEVLKGSPYDVQNAAMLMRMENPQAFRETVKNWMSQRFDDVFSAQKGRPEAPAEFAKSLQSNRNLDMVLREAAVGAVPDPDAFVQGFKNALKILEASGRPRPLPTGRGDLNTILAQSPEAMSARLAFGNQLSRPAALLQVVRNTVYRRQYEALSKVFQDPDSMRRMQDLANMPVVSERSRAYLSGILGSQVTLDGE